MTVNLVKAHDLLHIVHTALSGHLGLHFKISNMDREI